MGISTTHLIIFLVIIVLIFGTRKLKNIGSDLGSAVHGFKQGVKGGAEGEEAQPVPPSQQVTAAGTRPVDPDTVDVEARRRS